ADRELRGRVHDGDLRLDHVLVGKAEREPLRPPGRPPGGSRLVVGAQARRPRPAVGSPSGDPCFRCRHRLVPSTVELSRSSQSPVAMTSHGSASRSVMAGTRVTTAPRADLAEIRPMTMPMGAVPDSRVVWKKPDQPEDPLALGKTRILPAKPTPNSSYRGR